MIITRNLTKEYKIHRGGNILAVDNINFEVKDGDIFGFLGPNGAGKTTTIHMLTTVLEPTSGTAELAGFDIISEPLLAKNKMGFLPESPSFYEWLSAEDQLKFYSEFYGYSSSESKKRSRELIELVGLSEFKNHKIKTFSHGMRKRLALAQAMVNDPILLILDEPMGGLDPMGVLAFREMIKELNKNGITIFLSSHLLPEVQQICNRVGIINKGRILEVDSIRNLSKHVKIEPCIKIYIEGSGITEPIVDLIRSEPGVIEVQRLAEAGDEYSIMAELEQDSSQFTSELNKKLTKNNVYLSRIETAKPTLEDLFMNITRGR